MDGEILILATEAQIGRSLARICRLVDGRVGLAETPAQALAELAQAPVSLCLLGLGSPLSSFEILSFLREARAYDPLLEFIALSASDTRVTAELLPELGPHALLSAPWPEDTTLAAIIGDAMRHGQLRRRYEILRQLWYEGLEHLRMCSRALDDLFGTREMLAALVRSLTSISPIHVAGAIWSRDADASSPEVVLGSQAGLSASEASDLMQSLSTAVGRLEAGAEPEVVHLPPQTPDETASWRAREGEQALLCTGALGLSDGSCLALAIGGWRQGVCDDELQPLLSAFGALAQGAFERRATLVAARDQASRDSLTGLYDYAHFVRILAQALERAAHDSTDLVVLMLDVDSAYGLKQVNDRFGHQAGDRLLMGIADLLRQHVRPGDILARYGGDEFLILAPNTPLDEAQVLAERLLQIISEAEFVIEADVRTHISLSVGLAVASEPGQTPADLVAKADRGLYLAKAKGGARIGIVD